MPTPTTTETPIQIKARGAFYTPPAVADFLCRWAIRSAADRVLEPSCGDGVFVRAACRRFGDLSAGDLDGRLIGVELDAAEASKAASDAPGATIHNASFFDLSPAAVGGTVTAAIGNPPYIRYHGWTGEQRSSSTARALEQGVELSSLSSSWASFVVHATSFLANDGRLALVLPAELLHTNYAQAVRAFLLRRFGSVVIVAFDSLLFEDAQVDAVLLLASNDDQAGLRVIRLTDESALFEIGLLPTPDTDTPDSPTGNGAGHGSPSERWSAHVSGDVAHLYTRLVRSGLYQRLGDIASVDIGFVSGSNAYFVLSAKEARERRLPERALRPTVERPGDLAGLSVQPSELRCLFRPEAIHGPGQSAIRAYLEEGMKRGVAERYKPRHRKPWYRVPLPRRQADAFLPYMSHHAPRLITNNPGAVSSNLIHGVTLLTNRLDSRALAALSLSSLWALSAEVEGRAYGGGVLKLETKEAERLLLPVIDDRQQHELIAMFEGLDQLVRSGHRVRASEAVDLVLRVDRRALLMAAEVLLSRRQGRKASRASI